MPSNIELKVRWDNPDLAIEKAKSFGASFSKVMKQCDTYYVINNDKLKLREIHGETAELIYYRREGEEKWQSDYIVADVSDAKNQKKIFDILFGVLIEVHKVRTLYVFNNARIHIDEVEGLGSFLEFEVIIGEYENQDMELLNKLKEHFGIPENKLLKKSYSDLLLELR